MPKESTLVIRDISGKRIFRIEYWKYYEIVNELRSLGIDQDRAYDAGKWSMRAKPGDNLQVARYRLEIKA